MPTGPDLININSLSLSDTFNTWFIRTNQIIDALNPLQVYDVAAGSTSGMTIVGDGGSGGIAYFNVNVGAGIGIGTGTGLTYGNKVVIDFSDLETRGITLGTNPAVSDLFIVNDSSDTTLNSTGTPKSIPANKILPPTVDMDGNLTINAGTVTIAGDLVVSGSQTYLATSDLRVEDFQLEIAYQLAGYVGITGVTASDLLPFVGATAFFAPSGVTADATNATIIGIFKDATGPAAGSTAQVKIGSVFTRGTPSDFVNGGTLVVSGLTFDVIAVEGAGDFTVPGATTDFVNDVSLDEAGFVIKGSEGDKTLLWYNSDDAFLPNQNLGVKSATANAIMASRFTLPSTYSKNTPFKFAPRTSDDFELQMKLEMGETAAYSFYMDANESSNPLYFKGMTNAGNSFAIADFYLGNATGQTFPGVTTTNWAKYLNADLLDGAHAYVNATANSIPISNEYGVIESDWINARAIVKKFTQSGHGFSVGTAVRYDLGSNTYQKAYCDNPEAAETIGVVERVQGDDFWVNMQGYITGLSLSLTGAVYFLAPQSASGGYITDPTTLLNTDVQKAMIYSLSTSEGIVLGHPGLIDEPPTDTIYLNNAIPVGSIHSYAGTINREPLVRQGWLVCDGKRYYASDWSVLHGSIGQTYYAHGTIVSLNGEAVRIAFSGGDTLGFVGGTGSTGESVYIETVGGTGFDNYKFLPIAAGATSVTVSGLTTGTNPTTQIASNSQVRVYGRDQGLSTVFLVPDLRRRGLFGAGQGDGLTGTPQTPLSSLENLERAENASTTFAINETDAYGYFTTVNYLIRAKNAYDAVIITGHNHDLRYIRFDGTHDTSNGAGYNLTDADRSQFRSNAKVLRNDANDVFSGQLVIANGSTGSSDIDALTATGITTSSVWSDAALFVMGGSNQETAINLFNTNRVSLTADGARVNFFGVATGGTTNPRYSSSVVFGLKGADNLDEYGSAIPEGQFEHRVAINIGGTGNVDESALVVTRRTDANLGTGNGSIKYKLPKKLNTVTKGEAARPIVIDGDGQVLQGEVGSAPTNTSGFVMLPGNRLKMVWGTVTIQPTAGGNGKADVTFADSGFASTPINVQVSIEHPDPTDPSWNDTGPAKFAQWGDLLVTGMTVIVKAAPGSNATTPSFTVHYTVIGEA